MEKDKKQNSNIVMYDIIYPFVTQALLLMGVTEIPDFKTEIDFNGAKRAIDTIEYFKEITKGNLNKDDQKVLDDTIMQLKLTFVEMQKTKQQNTKEEEK